MAGILGDSVIGTAPTNPHSQFDQVELSQNIQSLSMKKAQGSASKGDPLAAPTSKWDKFIDVTEKGIEDIPQGVWHELQDPFKLAENAAISIGLGTMAKVFLPESGPLGSLCAVGLAAYFGEQTAVPLYKAYKTGMNAKTIGELNAAGDQVGDALGGLAVNVPIGIYGYRYGAGIGDSIMTSPKMDGIAQFKADTLNPINKALASGIESSKACIANILGSKSARPAALDEASTTDATTTTGTGDQAAAGTLRGSVEVTDKAPSDAAASELPTLPDRYRPIQENFSGTKVPGISRQFLKNLQTDSEGTYYGAGLRYPDVMADPEMKAFLEAHNKLTLSQLDQAGYDEELAVEAKVGGSFGQLPPGWDLGQSGRTLDSINVADGGDGSMRVGSKTITVTDDGAPNRKVVVSDGLGQAKTLIAEPNDFEIEQVVHVTANGADKYAVVGSQDGASVLHVYDADGKEVNQVPLPGYGTVHDVRAGATPSQVQFLYDTPIAPPQALTLDLATNKSDLSPLPGYNFNTDAFVTDKVKVPYTDMDGNAQEVPIYISHAKDMALNGQNRTLLEIYGGFDVAPQYLRYMPNSASWLQRGGVTVDPVLPGDGGLGSANYKEGLLAGIENNTLALAAIVQKLHEMGIASPETTAVYGRSNGGMVVNSVVNDLPELFGAAVSESGVNSLFDSPVVNVDTGRYWEPEFGNPRNPAQIAWMAKRDVLNNLSSAKQYPPTLVEIGTVDGVVNVGNGVTYAVIRQGMNNGDTYLYSRIGEGHDPTSLAFQTAFLWDHLKPTTDKTS